MPFSSRHGPHTPFSSGSARGPSSIHSSLDLAMPSAYLSHERSSSARADAASAAYDVLLTTRVDAAAAAAASDQRLTQDAASSAFSKVAPSSTHAPASSSDGLASRSNR